MYFCFKVITYFEMHFTDKMSVHDIISYVISENFCVLVFLNSDKGES